MQKSLLASRRTADINEIAMMFGRYVTLMDEMDAMSIYQELFANGQTGHKYRI